MRIRLSHITSVMVAGAAAAAIAAAPTAAAAGPASVIPAAITATSTSMADQAAPIAFHGAGPHGGGFRPDYGRGFHRGEPFWGWGPWFWGRHW